MAPDSTTASQRWHRGGVGRQVSRGTPSGNYSLEFRNSAERRPPHSRATDIVILSLDASTASGSVALVSETKSCGRYSSMFRAVAEGRSLQRSRKCFARRRPISRVTVGVGPGSYNGIRSAIAVAWGIATAREIPLIGISSLLGLDEGSYCAIGDARRGQYYFARVSCGILENEPALLSKERTRWPPCSGLPHVRSSRQSQSTFWKVSSFALRVQRDWLFSARI